MKLDLGCGTSPEEGYVGVDLPLDETVTPPLANAPHHAFIDESGIIRFDLTSGIPWPFADGSIDGLFSSHLIEHLPAGRITVHEWKPGVLGQHVLKCTGTQDALFWFLDEAARVCRPGAEFVLSWPALRNEVTGEICMAAFQDPTHYRFIDVQQVLYWSRQGRLCRNVSQYRVRCNWVAPSLAQRGRGTPEDSILENVVRLVKEL